MNTTTVLRNDSDTIKASTIVVNKQISAVHKSGESMQQGTITYLQDSNSVYRAFLDSNGNISQMKILQFNLATVQSGVTIVDVMLTDKFAFAKYSNGSYHLYKLPSTLGGTATPTASGMQMPYNVGAEYSSIFANTNISN